MYIYIYTYVIQLDKLLKPISHTYDALFMMFAAIRSRTNGVSTNRAAAKVMNFDRLGKKVRSGTFGMIKVG